jgi:hypothetical protein
MPPPHVGVAESDIGDVAPQTGAIEPDVGALTGEGGGGNGDPPGVDAIGFIGS